MKQLLYIISTVLLTFNLVSCREELELATDQNTAVIVGLLNPNDNAHFIKVTRSFIGDGVTNNLNIAKIPDSLYFNNVTVKVEELLGTNVLRTFQLHDTIIQNKNENGVFFAPDQKVSVFYTTDNAPLRGDCKYRMTANINNDQFIVQAVTDIVTGMTWGNIGGPYSNFNFINNPGEYRAQTIQVTNVGNAKRISGEVLFNYYETYTSGDSTFHSVPFPLGEVDLAEGVKAYNFSLNGKTFYERLGNVIPVNPNVTVRRCSAMVINVTGANELLTTYMTVNKPSLSIAQNKPEFTNLEVIKGEKLNVIGIFASRTTMTLIKPYASQVPQIQALTINSRRELCTGPYTGNLRFCSWHVVDKNTNYSWACQ